MCASDARGRFEHCCYLRINVSGTLPFLASLIDAHMHGSAWIQQHSHTLLTHRHTNASSYAAFTNVRSRLLTCCHRNLKELLWYLRVSK